MKKNNTIYVKRLNGHKPHIHSGPLYSRLLPMDTGGVFGNGDEDNSTEQERIKRIIRNAAFKAIISSKSYKAHVSIGTKINRNIAIGKFGEIPVYYNSDITDDELRRRIDKIIKSTIKKK